MRVCKFPRASTRSLFPFSGYHGHFAPSHASTSHVSSPQAKEQSHSSSKTFSSISSLWISPQKTYQPQPSDTALGTLQRMYFPKMKPPPVRADSICLAERSQQPQCNSQERKQGARGKSGRCCFTGGPRWVPVAPLFYLFVVQCSSTNIPRADQNGRGEPLVTRLPVPH